MKENNSDIEKMLTMTQAAKAAKEKGIVGLSAVWLRRLAQNGKIPGAVKVEAPGNDYWIMPASSLDKIERRKSGRPFKKVD